MIARIRGKLLEKNYDSAVVDVAGVGYEIMALPSDISGVQLGQEVTFNIYEVVREDQYTLYGFISLESKRFYGRLLSINGVGPKVAQAILAAASPDKLNQAIVAGDPDLLRGIAGVGPKTAQRIILELKGKIDQTSAATGDETYQALVGLGYTGAQAAAAVSALPNEVTDPAERVKLALKGLAK